MNVQSWITLIAGLGIGSAVTAWIQHWLKIKEGRHQSQREALEARYKVIILLMYAAYDFPSNKSAFRINRPDLTSRAAVLLDLHAEWVNMLLFASVVTLDRLRTFIADPSRDNLLLCAASMRDDLGRDPLNLTKLKLVMPALEAKGDSDATASDP